MDQTANLFYLSVGSGHRVAAQSLEEPLRRQGFRVHPATDPLSGRYQSLPGLIDLIQDQVNRNFKGAYSEAWHDPRYAETIHRLAAARPLLDVLADQLESGVEHVVICTHVMPLLSATHLRERGAIGRLYAVVTDFGAHSLWPDESVDGYFVGHADVAEALARRGFDPARLHVTGIPIPPRATPAAEPDSESVRVLVIAGGLRQGAYTAARQFINDMLGALEEQDGPVLSVSVVAGKNEAFKNALDTVAAASPLDLRPLGYVEDMAAELQAHDILVTKPGGLIVAEALASGTALILLPPGPGQEEENRRFLLRHNAALAAEDAPQAAGLIGRVAQDEQVLLGLRRNAARLGKPAAADAAATIVHAECSY